MSKDLLFTVGGGSTSEFPFPKNYLHNVFLCKDDLVNGKKSIQSTLSEWRNLINVALVLYNLLYIIRGSPK